MCCVVHVIEVAAVARRRWCRRANAECSPTARLAAEMLLGLRDGMREFRLQAADNRKETFEDDRLPVVVLYS